MKNVIFLTAGGGAGTIAATRILKQNSNNKVLLGDMNSYAAGFKFADQSFVLPAAGAENYLDVVTTIIQEHKVNVFVPLVDEEILKVYALEKNFPSLTILLPAFNFAEKMLDKWRFVQTFCQEGLPCPKTVLASMSIGDLKYPLIAKPRYGRGSRNVMELCYPQQIKAYHELTGLPLDMILLQEKIQGVEYTVSVVVSKQGKVHAVVPKQILQKAGVTIAAVTKKVDSIIDCCCAIQEKLCAHGPFNVQLILRDNGEPIVFEINPRYSTTIALTMAAGINEIELLLPGGLSDRNGLLPFEENVMLARYYEQIISRNVRRV